jgi:hypothetical protein
MMRALEIHNQKAIAREYGEAYPPSPICLQLNRTADTE